MNEAEQRAREIARLRGLLAAQVQSAELQATRAAALELDVRNRTMQVDIIRSSTSWRLTLPLRLAGRLASRGPSWARQAAEMIGKQGVGGLAELVRSRLALRRRQRRPSVAPKHADIYGAKLARPPAGVLVPRVLIVADLLLPQCAKYRVWQKQAGFARLGTACTVVDWRDHDRAWSALQTHALVIFYRVPGKEEPLALIEEAKRLGLPTYWEADDLIFDMGHYLANRNLATLAPELRESVLAGVDLFRTAMLACDRTIASTPALAERMREAAAGPATVIENGLDEETLEAAEAVRARQRPPRETVVIAYGSGSKAHDADFAEAAPGLAAVLAARPAVRLQIIGDLTLPDVLAGFVGRIERVAATGYQAYLGLLGAADISLAPLEATAFNDAKSNIKWMEAAILGLPSVCSPRAAFRAVIRDGETGLLAGNAAAWERALLRLVDDPGLRRRIGDAALADVLDRYAPDVVARAQLAPLVAGLRRRGRAALRVLAVNIYFAPVSFGGATIVAEEMVHRLDARADTEVYVFASQDGPGADYTLRRYEQQGVPVFGIKLGEHHPISEFDNPAAAAQFADVLRATAPDVVHFHAVQNLGTGLLRACAAAGVPYVVTVHDAWWLCGRQFMVKEDGGYCFQTRIDLSVCQACMPKYRYLRPRFAMLMQALEGAALVLSPSEAHRQLYLANGLDPARVLVNQNGIRLPERPRRRPPGDAVRFGFVGGISHLKGYHVLREAFAGIAASNYELILVDATLKLGFASIETADWQIAGTLRVVPPFDQAGLDVFFDGIDVLLFPSQWKESFGLIVAEALARDVWVVVTEGGGASEFVVEGENGTLIPLRNDPAPLRAAIEALLADPARLRGHVNPHKGLIVGYQAQVEELRGMLASVARLPLAEGEGDERPLRVSARAEFG